MLGIAEVPTYHQDPDLTTAVSIDHGIRKVMQWMNSAKVICGRANGRELNQQLGDALELVQEAVCELCATLLAIEPSRLEKVELCPSMEAVSHPRLARTRAMASGPETSTDGSASACASRLAASSFQRASRSRSASRLLIT